MLVKDKISQPSMQEQVCVMLSRKTFSFLQIPLTGSHGCPSHSLTSKGKNQSYNKINGNK